MKGFIKQFLVILYILFPLKAYSHPHVFFESSFIMNIDKDTVQNIEVELILDEMNTLVYEESFSSKKNENIPEKNISFFSDIREHIHLYYNNSEQKQNLIFENAFLSDENLIIHFRIPVNKKINKNDKIIFSVYDPQYYYTYDYGENELKENIKNSISKVNVDLKENENKSFYFGMVYPMEYEVTFY